MSEDIGDIKLKNSIDEYLIDIETSAWQSLMPKGCIIKTLLSNNLINFKTFYKIIWKISKFRVLYKG